MAGLSRLARVAEIDLAESALHAPAADVAGLAERRSGSLSGLGESVASCDLAHLVEPLDPSPA